MVLTDRSRDVAISDMMDETVTAVANTPTATSLTHEATEVTITEAVVDPSQTRAGAIRKRTIPAATFTSTAAGSGMFTFEMGPVWGIVGINAGLHPFPPPAPLLALSSPRRSPSLLSHSHSSPSTLFPTLSRHSSLATFFIRHSKT